jgi:hypothetical protein
MKNKEYGSDFHLVTDQYFLLSNKHENLFATNNFSLFFSGRVALFNLLNEGIKNNNWTEVYVPSFYCHEVVNFINTLPIEVIYYDFNPFLDSENKEFKFKDIQTSVVVNVLYFGIKKLNLVSFKNIIQVEDITHNILESEKSKADYCFGSLRKELPVPVGGFCSSPKNKPLPSSKYNFESEQVSIQKLTAMFLKNLYLSGNWENKSEIRNLFIDAENKFEFEVTNTLIPHTSKTILSKLDCKTILETKHKNIKQALPLLVLKEYFSFNINSNNNTVFGLVIHCKNSDLQTKLKQFLINNNIYPAVLWANQIEERDKEIENQILFIHLDYRYDENEINFIVNTINAFKHND